MFTIPPPPIPRMSFEASRYRTPHFTRRDYGYAWVPSANSAFPPGYDPRLTEGTNGDGGTEASQRVHEKPDEAAAVTPSVSGAVVPHQHAQPESRDPVPKFPLAIRSGGGEKIVIKKYKPKSQPPRFVPRQVKDSKAAEANTSSKHSTAKAEEEEVNREIRREAFRLGQDQGPLLPTDPETRERLLGQRPLVEPAVEASVVTSVKAIRKRLSKVGLCDARSSLST